MAVAYPAPRPGSPLPVKGSSAGSVVLLTLGFVLIAVCAVAVTAVVLLSTGPTSFVVGLLFALLPVVPLLAYFRWLDRYEPEPGGLLVFAFGWGAAVATLGSLVLNLASVYALDADGRDSEYISTVFVAPVVEEALKGLGLLAIVFVGRRGLDSLVDGVVYAGVIGVGFAFVENILYLGGALTEGGGLALVTTFVARGLMSPFAHPLFTSATGIGLALAARHGGAGRLLAFGGYAVAVLLHALWNGTASQSLGGFVTTFLVIHVPLFATYIGLAMWFRSREGRLIRRHLQSYAAAGWLSAAELQMVADLKARKQALSWAADAGGARSRSSLKRFQRAAVELAYLRARIVAGTAPRDAAWRERGLLEKLSAERAAVVPRLA